MKNSELRWVQRFQNFEKVFLRLNEAMDLAQLNELEGNGLIQHRDLSRIAATLSLF